MRSAAALATVALAFTGASPCLAADPPVVLALALDTSGSLRPADLERAGSLATSLLKELPGGSEAAVFGFDDQSRLLLPRTADAEAVQRTLLALHPGGRFTALYDALYDASRYLRDAGGVRRAVVLLTDGRDENSTLSIEDGLRVAQETRIPVFCVGVGRIEERGLRRIAKLTAGDYVSLEEATGPALAGRILAVAEAVAAPAMLEPPTSTATPAVVPASGPVPAPLARPWPTWLLAGVLVGLGLLLAAAVLLRSEPRRARLSSVLSPAGGQGVPRPPGQLASETVLARLDLGSHTVERTVLLREKATLAVTAGKGQGRLFPLSEASATSVGRAGANDIVLEEETVSGQHFRIRPEAGGFVLHDLGSTNGTKVNEQRVTRHTLQDGDVIRVGEAALEFRLTRRRSGS